MKKTQVKTHRISFQEKTSKGFVDRSFDTPKETVGTNVAGRLVRPEGSQSGVGALHLEWHLSQMKKSPDARRLGILPSPCYQGC